jgi:hypothetical protein
VNVVIWSFSSEALGRYIFTFNLKCVHILRNKVKGCLAKRRDYRVYEKVELRIYKNDFSNSSNRSACRFYFFYKATKIIIDLYPTSIGKISKEMVKPR